eukprot:4255057-Alexandrium_andersonii.AAC.1
MLRGQGSGRRCRPPGSPSAMLPSRTRQGNPVQFRSGPQLFQALWSCPSMSGAGCWSWSRPSKSHRARRG